MSLSEFDLITRFFNRGPVRRTGVELGIGDDAAVVNVPPGQSLVMSMDTLVAGVHFSVDTPAKEIGHKALAVNLSDIAAMGATPNWMLLGLTMPQANEAWLTDFSCGLTQLADEHNVALIGGDTTHGPLSITIQINGLVPHGQALQRSGAQHGDLIFVTGQLGDAGLALKLEMQQLIMKLSPQRRDYFIHRLHRPTPRLAAGQCLRGLASSAIDVSDGLLADLGHILTASGVGAVIHLEQLPVAPEVKSLSETWWDLPLCAGDDYELCFTVSADKKDLVVQALQAINCPCRCIGRIEPTRGLKVLHHGKEIDTSHLKGYLHFE